MKLKVSKNEKRKLFLGFTFAVLVVVVALPVFRKILFKPGQVDHSHVAADPDREQSVAKSGVAAQTQSAEPSSNSEGRLKLAMQVLATIDPTKGNSLALL